MARAVSLSAARIEQIAHETAANLPEPFRSLARDVAIVVEDWPDDQLLDEMEIDDPLDLTGVYEGTPITEKSFADPAPRADVIRLFLHPIRTELLDRGNVTAKELVSHVVIHELAHHFGWSDDDIAAIDRWWE